MQTLCGMNKLKNYNLVFSGLPLGISDYTFELSQEFFDLFNFDQDFANPRLNVAVELEKKSSMLELNFTIKGDIEVSCDLTGENFDQNFSNKTKLIVKFGDEFDDSDTDIWIVPQEEYQLNLAQLFFELALLSLPTKRIHPDVETGNSTSEILSILDQYSLTQVEFEEEIAETPQEEDEDETDEIDPRWAKLKDLKP